VLLNTIKCIEVGLKHLWKELRLHGLSNNKYKFKRRLQCFCKDKWALIFYLMKVRVRIRDQDCNHFMKERFICLYMDKNNCCVCNGSNK